MSRDHGPLDELGDGWALETPHAAALGIRLVSVRAGAATMAISWRADLVGEPATGAIAGGVIAALLDHACGLAVASAAGAGHSTATLDLRIDHLRAAAPQREIFARAHCYQVTGAIAFARASAFEADEGDPVAIAQAAFVLNEAPAP